MRYCDKCFAVILDNGQGHKEWCPKKPAELPKEFDELFGTLKKKPK